MSVYSKYFDNNALIKSFFESSKLNLNLNILLDKFKKALTLIPNDGFLDSYNFSNVHHSLIYNNLYHPHYNYPC